MIKVIPGLPEGVIGFEAVGKVKADDYRTVLDPAVAKVAEAHGKVRMLYVLGDDYEGFSTGAMWQDSKLGFADRKSFERIAVATDHNRVIDAIKVFAWMVPGEVRTYTMDQLDDAKAWLSEQSD